MRNDKFVMDALKEIAEQRETLVMEQLNELISRGLLVVEQGPMSLMQDLVSTKILVAQQVRLVLKDQEYIQKLEVENKSLKQRLDAIANAVGGSNE